MRADAPETRPRPRSALMMLAFHALAAVLMLNRLPRGFPLSHVRFYSNEAAPVLLLALCALAGALLWRGRAAAGALLALFPALWLGAAIGARVTFPLSGHSVVVGALVGALLLGALWARLARRLRPRRGACLGVAGLGLALGWALLRAQRAPISTTRPQSGAALEPATEAVELPANVSVDDAGASVRVRNGALELSLFPLLDFESRSPDGFWTLFSALPRELPQTLDPAFWRLRVSPRSNDELFVHVTRALPDQVFSHLNSFTTFTLRGHRKLGISFSPCPDAVIEFVYADYPAGAPARFAYLDETSRFHVVQATSAEKGPFTTLARGRLRRGEPLSIRLLELSAGAPKVRFELDFDDWSQQLSTALSPTAGFGVAENAIQFGLRTPSAGSEAYVILNLAATSIGRGWDSVGHARGRYENRVTLRSR